MRCSQGRIPRCVRACVHPFECSKFTVYDEAAVVPLLSCNAERIRSQAACDAARDAYLGACMRSSVRMYDKFTVYVKSLLSGCMVAHERVFAFWGVSLCFCSNFGYIVWRKCGIGVMPGSQRRSQGRNTTVRAFIH